MTSDDPRRFDVAVPPGGYAWWYLDALSDERAGEPRRGLTIIAFLGSVFSPYYAHARHAARRRNDPSAADPLDHCALNVALYGGRSARWSMTERGRRWVTRDAARLAIGASALAWTPTGLSIRVDEIAVPRPTRVRGVVHVTFDAPTDHRVALDDAGRHRWGVIAPNARIDVAFDAPDVRWSGTAYLDSNRGCGPLEDDFVRWDWSRAHGADGRAAVVYDIERRDGTSRAISHRFAAGGRVEGFAAPPTIALPRTGWRLDRATRSDAGTTPRVVHALEDGPFYSRTVVAARWQDEPVTMVHEHLDLQRFERRWVRALLPFRMPRRAG